MTTPSSPRDTPSKPRDALSKPHDLLFRRLVSDTDRAAVLLRTYFPDGVRELLDPDRKPELMEGAFVDQEGRSSQSDAVFRVHLRNGQSLHAFALLEHKSSPERKTALQVLNYINRIWAREVEERRYARARPLPRIYPLVFYNGERKWTAPMSVAEMIQRVTGREASTDWAELRLIDLGRLSDDKFPQEPATRAGLLALAKAFSGRITPTQLDMITGGPVADSELEEHVLVYAAALKAVSKKSLRDSIRRTKPHIEESIMGTIAETYIAEGIAQGQSGLLLDQLEQRFGPLTEAVRSRVQAASSDDLKAWGNAVLDAESLDAVFARGSRS